MGIWSVVALGLNIITGLAGQFNLGVGVYMGTGAYASAMLTTAAGFSFWEALGVGRGASGASLDIAGVPRAPCGGEPVTNLTYLMIVVAALALSIAAALYLRRSWMGLAWESIREDETSAQVLGIDPARYKLYAFTIGAVFAGLGGVLYAHFIRFVTPYDFGFLPS